MLLFLIFFSVYVNLKTNEFRARGFKPASRSHVLLGRQPTSLFVSAMTQHAPVQGHPPEVNQQLLGWFRAVDTDGSGQLTADELQRALINGDWSPFNIETVRMMVNMFDQYGIKEDQSGTIGFNEFSGLWRYVEEWKRCFQAFDADSSGSINRLEMGNALRSFGYNLSDRFVNLLINKFDKYGHWSQGKGDVTFDNFVQACVTIRTLTDSFRHFDTDSDGWIQINYEDFLDLVVRQRS